VQHSELQQLNLELDIIEIHGNPHGKRSQKATTRCVPDACCARMLYRCSSTAQSPP
jgi:hypothetical protein